MTFIWKFSSIVWLKSFFPQKNSVMSLAKSQVTWLSDLKNSFFERKQYLLTIPFEISNAIIELLHDSIQNPFLVVKIKLINIINKINKQIINKQNKQNTTNKQILK